MKLNRGWFVAAATATILAGSLAVVGCASNDDADDTATEQASVTGDQGDQAGSETPGVTNYAFHGGGAAHGGGAHGGGAHGGAHFGGGDHGGRGGYGHAGYEHGDRGGRGWGHDGDGRGWGYGRGEGWRRGEGWGWGGWRRDHRHWWWW